MDLTHPSWLPLPLSLHVPPSSISVHDPTAWLMGGVAGHAGLFSSIADVARVGAESLLM